MFPFEHRLSEEQKKELLNQYTSLEMGYFVLYTKVELEKRGYKVSRKSEDLRCELEDGKRIVYDLKAEKDEKVMFIDLDMGRMQKQDFMNALDKRLQVSSDIYIVAIDERTLYNYTKRYSFMWIKEHLGGIEKVKGNVKLHFSTLEWLIVNEKEWEHISF